jgi:bacterioferritin
MKGHSEVVDALNAALTAQLTAINQLFLSAKMHEHRGFLRLARAEYKQSIQVMRAAESIIDRVLLLEGLPNLQRIGKIQVAEGSVEQLSLDLALQRELTDKLTALAQRSLAHSDHGTAELAESLLTREQRFLLWLEAQQRELALLGEAHYLAAQVHDGPAG